MLSPTKRVYTPPKEAIPCPLKPQEQLLLVLPLNSLHLNDNLKNKDYYYPKGFYTNTFMKRYSWEGYPILPE